MSNTTPLFAEKESESLEDFTREQRRARIIEWYRSPISKELFKELHRRNDWLGFLQSSGHLAVLLGTGGTALYAAGHWAWWVTALALLAHGTVCAFMINAVHELGHGVVFGRKWLNQIFLNIFAFIGWNNYEHFQVSHTRHHRYTLHPPDDLEVVLPIRLMLRNVLKLGLVNPRMMWFGLKSNLRLARGRFEGEWEMTIFPPEAPQKRRPVVRLSRAFLLGHGLIAVVAVATGHWMVPLVTSLTPLYGGWLQMLCNNTQHVGLQDNVADFRLCTRTFTVNPVVQFLYWHMNYHIEHHMYAAVPCYHLGRLHRAIKADLPATPAGLVAVWKEIDAIMAKQRVDPGYQHQALVPVRG